jgi:hypothetical protein
MTNKIVSSTCTRTIHLAGGGACIDNALDISSMAMSRTFRCRHAEKPPRGLYSRHTGSDCIDDPLDTGPYIQQDNI